MPKPVAGSRPCLLPSRRVAPRLKSAPTLTNSSEPGGFGIVHNYTAIDTTPAFRGLNHEKSGWICLNATPDPSNMKKTSFIKSAIAILILFWPTAFGEVDYEIKIKPESIDSNRISMTGLDFVIQNPEKGVSLSWRKASDPDAKGVPACIISLKEKVLLIIEYVEFEAKDGVKKYKYSIKSNGKCKLEVSGTGLISITTGNSPQKVVELEAGSHSIIVVSGK